jgi:soluble lytic murein transglycosylase-like protein
MDDSFFAMQMQQIMYKLMLKLMEKAGLDTGAKTASTSGATSAAQTVPSAGTAGSATSAGSATPFETLIDQAGARYGVDPKLVKAVISVAAGRRRPPKSAGFPRRRQPAYIGFIRWQKRVNSFSLRSM